MWLILSNWTLSYISLFRGRHSKNWTYQYLQQLGEHTWSLRMLQLWHLARENSCHQHSKGHLPTVNWEQFQFNKTLWGHLVHQLSSSHPKGNALILTVVLKGIASKPFGLPRGIGPYVPSFRARNLRWVFGEPTWWNKTSFALKELLVAAVRTVPFNFTAYNQSTCT